MKPARRTRTLTLLLLLILLILGGCSPSTKGSLEAAPSSHSESDEATEQQEAFDVFLDELFINEVSQDALTLHYTLADPAPRGINDLPDTFGTYSLEGLKEATESARETLDALAVFDQRLLREDQRRDSQILASWLETRLRADGLEHFSHPLSSSLGIQAQYPLLLSEYELRNREDIRAYLSLLASIEPFYAQLAAYEEERAGEGLFLSDAQIDRICASLAPCLVEASESFLASSFDERLEAVPGLTQEERDAYSKENLAVLTDHFIPACSALTRALENLKGNKKEPLGLAADPGGRQYYEYLAFAMTGTSCPTLESLKESLLQALTDEMEGIGWLLSTDPDLAGKAASYSFSLTAPEAILDDLSEKSRADFPDISQYPCRIQAVPQSLESFVSPAFYLSAPIDRKTESCIYINYANVSSTQDLYTTLAHEGIPGHMYQDLYFKSQDAHDIRKLMPFLGYTEGWATYAELYALSFESGFGDGLAELLKYNTRAYLSAMALLDIYIHYDGFTLSDTGDFLSLTFGLSDPAVTEDIYLEIVENPANYLGYYAGYMEIMQMRGEAEDALGDAFDPMAFHRFLLDFGPAPFSIIRTYFTAWLLNESR